jgi:hypothetical protein
MRLRLLYNFSVDEMPPRSGVFLIREHHIHHQLYGSMRLYFERIGVYSLASI